MVQPVARLAQGFSTGGELGGATSYMLEIAPSHRRGVYTCLQAFTVGLGVMAGTGVGALLTNVLSRAEVESWGWRIPFLPGGTARGGGPVRPSAPGRDPGVRAGLPRGPRASTPGRHGRQPLAAGAADAGHRAGLDDHRVRVRRLHPDPTYRRRRNWAWAPRWRSRWPVWPCGRVRARDGRRLSDRWGRRPVLAAVPVACSCGAGPPSLSWDRAAREPRSWACSR